MPSFSSLLKRSKSQRPHGATKGESPQSNDVVTCNESGAVGPNGANEKAQRRRSKRDFFRSLLSSGPPRSDSRAERTRSLMIQESKTSSPGNVSKSMPNSNKPLPPPPSSSADERSFVLKSPVKLNKIISPIAVADVHKLFWGAPQFLIRMEEASPSEPPKALVIFPWNDEVHIRDLCDHYQIDDQAWGFITAYPHITFDFVRSKETNTVLVENNRAHFVPRCYERPNMLSIQGIERGTTGFTAALEMDVADALKGETEQPSAPSVESLTKRRADFLDNKKYGIRSLDVVAISKRLVDIGSVYDDFTFHNRSNVEWYTELFTQVLFPPSRVTDSDDPYSLSVQIKALINILATPNLWIDLSLVEWRIRLGQTLWASEQGEEENITPARPETAELRTQKFWLLLQILLSCELLLRLDAVTKKAEHDSKPIKAEDVRKFEKDVQPSVRWSMILARIWLDNIRIEEVEHSAAPQENKPTSSWLPSLTGAPQPPAKDEQLVKAPTFVFQGKYQARQVSGLVHFARKIQWPQAETLAASFLRGAGNFAGSAATTPIVRTPLSTTSQTSSYFGISTRNVHSRGLSKRWQQRRSTMIQPSGWLSRSYLTGLILPGEGLSHFLISTLLENDESAITKLGDEANLYGGFIYSLRSYWSTHCVIGRVLAAGKGASECIGWLSSDVLPRGIGDGWIDIQVESAPVVMNSVGSEKPRIWNKKAIERDSSVLGDGDESMMLPGDFTLPAQIIQDDGVLEVKLESLELFAAGDTEHDIPSSDRPTPSSQSTEVIESREIKSYAAMMTFLVLSGISHKTLSFELSYDVHFVTAHPCVPSHHTGILDSPTNPPFRVSSPLPVPSKPGSRSAVQHSGHPLHKSFSYKRDVFSNILIPHSVQSAALVSPFDSLNKNSQEVLVIDCNERNPPSQAPPDTISMSTSPVARRRHWGSDLEMLARAWCAEKGYNALISRKGRNCVACSVREARALGWKIVLRFG